MTWAVPGGITIGTLQWPVPQRFTTDSIVNYGYEGTATLLVPLTISRSTKIGATPVRAKISLLECAQMCIPEETTLDLDLRHASGTPVSFAQARAELPQPFDGSAQATVGPKLVVLTLTGRALKGLASNAVQFIPATGRVVDNDFSPFIKVDWNTLTWTAPRLAHARPVARFEGVLTISAPVRFPLRRKTICRPQHTRPTRMT